MENKEKLKEFYRLVKDARESCAGSSIKVFSEVKHNLIKAIGYGIDNDMSTVYIGILVRSKRMLQGAKEYGDRLKPDELLCELCNKLLKEIEDA